MTVGLNSSKAQCAFIGVIMIAILGVNPVKSIASETWRGLTIAQEHRCSLYNRKRDYKYTTSIEEDIVAQIGKIYSPFTGTCFNSTAETDVDHIVALSEAHDSGLCETDPSVRTQFASDIRNLTIASPFVNRTQKRGKDAGEWLPDINGCWFAGRVLDIKRAYGLTIDQKEANALEEILANCTDTAMEPVTCLSFHETESQDVKSVSSEILRQYDDNQNGQITCKEARRHGIAPVPKTHPAYLYMIDGDRDGVVCE